MAKNILRRIVFFLGWSIFVILIIVGMMLIFVGGYFDFRNQEILERSRIIFYGLALISSTVIGSVAITLPTKKEE